MQEVTWSDLFAAFAALVDKLWPVFLAVAVVWVVGFYTFVLPAELRDILKELRAIRKALAKESEPKLGATTEDDT